MTPNNVKRIKNMTREINALNKRLAELFTVQENARNNRDFDRIEAELYIVMNDINQIAIELACETRIAAEVALDLMSEGANAIVVEDLMKRTNNK